ncbi:MAG: AI-2E family transporter [Pyrinomonadaceae bacterium]|nr:AI-2E family transporter [Pyrinomonadaceae bacterium]
MSKQDSKRLSELTVGDAKRTLVYGVAVLLAVALFVWLVGKVLVALLLGVVAAVYLLPVQEWLERRLGARTGSALVTIALIVVPMVALIGYVWYELSGYSNLVHEKRDEIIDSISGSLARYFPVGRENTRGGLQTAFAEGVTRSAEAVQALRKSAPLLLASLAVFFFTVFYVLTQRTHIPTYIKVRVPGDYLPLYEKLAENIGGALRGALQAVFIDQSLKAVVIVALNLVFGVPLAVVLGMVTFLTGFFPLIGEWVIYIPVSIYLLVFRNAPISAAIYAAIGISLTLSSSLLLRPRLASSATRSFNFYWMFVALVAGVYAFGIPGIVLGPAILGFTKAVADTLLGNVRYETSLLRSENDQVEAAQAAEDQIQEDALNSGVVQAAN